MASNQDLWLVATKHDHSSHSNRPESRVSVLESFFTITGTVYLDMSEMYCLPHVGEIEREKGIRVIFQHAGALYSLLYVTTALSSSKLSIA